jgi:hypothetical protein
LGTALQRLYTKVAFDPYFQWQSCEAAHTSIPWQAALSC